MTNYTIRQGYPPSQEEIFHWNREAAYFRFHEPNPRAPQGSHEAKGWGIPKNYMPPPDAVTWVMSRFKREVAGVPYHEKLRPEFKFSILSVCMAHFLWLRQKEGAQWLLRFFGVEEVPPFWEGYEYYYVHGQTQTPIHIEKDGGLELRCWRRTSRELSPPIPSADSDVIPRMKELLSSRRNPNALEPIPEASEGMYFWVSEQIRDWFLETRPNKQVPTPKADRITGLQWAENLERSKGQPFYEALAKMKVYKDALYRIKDKRGGIVWTGAYAQNQGGIKTVPRFDGLRHRGQLDEHGVKNMFQCSSCGKIRACLPITQHDKMCCACYGRFVEQDQRPMLDWCTMRECRACPDHISNQNDLISLKNRLNREISFPVQR